MSTKSGRGEGVDEGGHGFASDEALLSGMLARRPRAWAAFDRRFGRLVHHCVAKVTGRFRSGLTSEDTREAHAQFLLSIVEDEFRRLRAFDPTRGQPLASWIAMLATNAAWDHMRRVRRMPMLGSSEAADVLHAGGVDPFEQLALRERGRRVEATIQGLSPRDREVVRLLFDDGLRPEQVADALAISVKTVYSKTHKIRARLARAVDEGALAA